MGIKGIKTKKTRATSLYCVLITFVLILVEFIVFCDFGRYFVWLIFCFTLIFGYITVNNQKFKEILIDAYDLNKVNKIGIVLFMLLFTPFMSSSYNLLLNILIGG